MHFSFSSVLMTLLASNLLLIPITLLFRNEKLLAEIGYKVMSVFCIVTLIRLLFPYELPFTKTVALPASLSDVISILRHPYELIPGYRIPFTSALCVAWFAVSIILLFRIVRNQMKLRAIVMRNSKDVTKADPYAAILRALCSERECRRIRLYSTPFTDAPMIMGLLKPIILLPQDANPIDSDLLFALRHELYHYRHHDLWLKFFVNFVTTFYWWNPFCTILTHQAETLLEMRVDDSIASEGDETATEYVAAILHYLKNTGDSINPSSQFMGMTFSQKSSMSHRVNMIRNRKSKPDYLVSVALLLLTFSLYIGSYLIIFENNSYLPEITESESYVVPESTNSYAIPNADGTYTIYLFDGRCTEIVDSLEYYPDTVVYSSKEEHDETVQKDK